MRLIQVMHTRLKTFPTLVVASAKNILPKIPHSQSLYEGATSSYVRSPTETAFSFVFGTHHTISSRSFSLLSIS